MGMGMGMGEWGGGKETAKGREVRSAEQALPKRCAQRVAA